MEYDERIILKGSSKVLKPMITQMLLMRQMLESLELMGGSFEDRVAPPVKRRGKPKVSLYFQQDSNFRPGTVSTQIGKGARRRDGVISFRLMDETPNTFSEGNQRNIANRIKDVFGINNGYVWEKGKDLYAYTDWDNGYQFELLTRTANEARRIITSVLSLRSHTPDWKYLTHSEAVQPELKYPLQPGKKFIAGKEREQYEQRPVVDVRFKHAIVEVEGLIEPIHLYDRTHRLKDALVI